jgi:O-antigen/teichoic acid export membrane protein
MRFSMIFAVAFFVNSVANFAFGIVLSAMLGPAEFGRYATVALAANTLSAAAFDWLRQSSLRFSGEGEGRPGIAASLDAGYLAVMALLTVGVAAAALFGLIGSLSLSALLLTPFLALALSRIDYAGAQFRAREQGIAFAALYALRQTLGFTAVIAVAYLTRNWALTIAALAAANLLAAIALNAPLRTPGARLSQASGRRLAEFFVYAKPIVASLVVYQLVALINRQAALDRLGAVATGELSLATDLGQRLFLAVNSLPEFLLFQYALQRARADGHKAAERQLGVNMALALALLAPLAAGYMAMAPTFEALLVPAAYRGDYARLSLELAPGFLAFCAISSMLNPVFQLAKRTWLVIIAALGALVTDLALLQFADAAGSTDALARAYSISIGVGLAIAIGLAATQSSARPRLRDVAAIAAATIAMTLVVRPFNGLASHALAAVLAVVVGGGLYGAIVLLFDVAGLRAFALERLRAPGRAWSSSTPPRP